VLRNGIERMTVNQPGCPDRPSSTATHTIELEVYSETRRSSSVQVSTVTVDNIFRRTTAPGSSSCTASGGTVLRDQTVTVDGDLSTTCNPQAASDCSVSLRDVNLTARNLVSQRTYAPPACDLSTTVDGQLLVNNEDRDETFAQTFDSYRISETLIGTTRLMRSDGRMIVDCLGEVRVETMQPLAMEAGADICADQGALRIFLPPEDGAGGGSETADGLGGGASSRSEQGGLIDLTFRSANGRVYQILQNPNGFPEARTEDVRITTLVGSNDGTSNCSDRSLGQGAAQAVAAAEPGTLVPAEGVRLSRILQLAPEPCFNPNGEGGAGLVCLGDGCSDDCRCPNQGCITFTIADGFALGDPTNGGRIVGALAPFEGDCSGAAGDSTYAFGPTGPSVIPGLCGAVPTDGFTLQRGQSRIVAYDTPAAAEFFSGAAGFLIDTDGDNQRGCAAGRVISGVATANELGAAIVTFDRRAVSFDVNDDGVIERSVADCEELSISACGLPAPTATATPEVPRPCPETRSFTSPVIGSTRNSFNLVRGGASCGDGGIASPDRSFLFRAPAAGCYRIDTLDTSGIAQPFDTLLYVRSGDSCNGPEIACNDNVAPSVLQSQVFIELDLAQNVVIVVDGSSGASGDFRLHVEPSEGCEAVPTFTVTPTASPTTSPAATSTSSPTATSTSSNTPDPSATSSPTDTPTATFTPTSSPAPTSTPTASPSSTRTPTVTPAATATATPSPTETETETPLPPDTPTATRTSTRPTSTSTRTLSPTVTPTPTRTATFTLTPSATPFGPTPTPSVTSTPSSSPTRTPSRTRTPTRTATATPTPTAPFGLARPTPKPSTTSTGTPTPTPTPTAPW
jgi:hypothetical protein